MAHVDCVTQAPGYEKCPGPRGKGEQKNIGPGENVLNELQIFKQKF